MSEDNWIDEQEKNDLFMGGERSGDADRMLEKSPANRLISSEQSVLLTINRALARVNHDSEFINQICDDVEYSQLACDGKARDDFMKVAIEQFQAKLANMRRSLADKLL